MQLFAAAKEARAAMPARGRIVNLTMVAVAEFDDLKAAKKRVRDFPEHGAGGSKSRSWKLDEMNESFSRISRHIHTGREPLMSTSAVVIIVPFPFPDVRDLDA